MEEQEEHEEKFRINHLYRNHLKSPRTTKVSVSICDHIPGLRPNICLYKYQKHSIARMFERETFVEMFDDPIWEKVTSETESTQFRNLITGEMRSTPPSTLCDERGGILCEDMGTGKTVICLSLILLTKGINSAACSVTLSGIKSKPPSPYVVRTELTDKDGNLHSLQRLCANRILCLKDHHCSNLGQDLHEYLDSLPLPYYIHGVNSSLLTEYTFRQRNLKCYKVFLSHATLIVVPASLVDQWRFEIWKFVENDHLNVLICNNGNQLPPASILATYDLVIVTHNVLQHAKFGGEGFAPSEDCGWNCDFDIDTHACKKCGNMNTTSPLMGVCWLRVIVDEGHVMGADQTRQTKLASYLFAERRWSCSGTPLPDSTADAELKHLYGLMKFLKQAPWTEQTVWNSLVVKPFKQHDKTVLKRLKTMLQRLMVRSTEKDIEQDIVIPKLHRKVVSLNFTPIEAARYNQMVAHVKSNLVSARHEGQDCLTDGRNYKYAREALTKLIDCCYARTGLSEEERDHCADTIRVELEDPFPAHKSPLSEEDKQSLLAVQEYVQQLLPLQSPYEDGLATKVQYLLKRVRGLPEGSKCIVFTQSRDTMRRLMDEFDKHKDIKYLEFHTKVAAQVRSSNVNTFNTSDRHNVFLMATQLAAYGINLIGADHIFFVDPVMDKNKEAQAIKRAHRIGQTREVFVENIIIKGTVEELILERQNEERETSEKKEAYNQRKLNWLLEKIQAVRVSSMAEALEQLAKIKEAAQEWELLNPKKIAPKLEAKVTPKKSPPSKRKKVTVPKRTRPKPQVIDISDDDQPAMEVAEEVNNKRKNVDMFDDEEPEVYIRPKRKISKPQRFSEFFDEGGKMEDIEDDAELSSHSADSDIEFDPLSYSPAKQARLIFDYS